MTELSIVAVYKRPVWRDQQATKTPAVWFILRDNSRCFNGNTRACISTVRVLPPSLLHTDYIALCHQNKHCPSPLHLCHYRPLYDLSKSIYLHNLVLTFISIISQYFLFVITLHAPCPVLCVRACVRRCANAHILRITNITLANLLLWETIKRVFL